MKFKNLEDLVRYIVNEPINLEFTDVEFKPNLEDDKKEIKENFEAKITALFDPPILKGSWGDENILFVESVEGTKNFCGAGKVKIAGREILTQLCEMDGTSYLTLSIDIGDEIVENVKFKLEPSNNETKNTLILKDESN